MNQYVIFVNTTKQCNIDCKKCYLTEDNRRDRLSLPVFLLEKLISSPEILAAKDVVIVFQGGEASLVGEKKLVEYCELIKKVIPGAKMTMVSNFVSMPDWLISIAKKYFRSKIETTFAFRGKYIIGSGSDLEQRYVEKFKIATKKVVDSGISCTINFEANPESLALGPEKIIELSEETGCYSWEFDFSVDFQEYLKNQAINVYGYPALILRERYSKYSEYMSSLIDVIEARGFRDRFISTMVSYLKGLSDNSSFNIAKDSNFLTINPDGALTTNPLFSDISGSFLGNLNTSVLSELLSSPLRRSRARFERQRMSACMHCPYFKECNSGPSHVPVVDGSGECVGMFNLRSKLIGDGRHLTNHPLSSCPGFRDA